MDMSVPHLSEMNVGDEIIRTLFTVNSCHLDQSVIDGASFQRPILFTQHLNTKIWHKVKNVCVR